MDIKGFFGKYRWLSNFWITPVMYDNVIYASVEHAYQAAKTADKGWRRQLELTTSAKEAKAVGYKVPLREDWENVKLNIMYQLVKDKFTRNIHLREWLKATDSAYLEETNTWGDIYWGVCDGVGENQLGRILMQVRELLQADKI